MWRVALYGAFTVIGFYDATEDVRANGFAGGVEARF